MTKAVYNTIRHWWVFLLRGLFFVLVGIYMVSFPIASFAAIGFIVGIVVILTGISELMHAYAHRYVVGWNWRFLLGFADMALGLFLAFDLSVSIVVLPFILGAWFLLRGFSLFSFASVIRHSLWLVVGGLVTVVFALMVIFNPVFGVMTIVLWAAFAFMITGIANVILAFRLKTASEVLTKG